ncbi:MAG TPA: hypothetical protein VHL58_14020 [Thermoanaerobaculia bacterium]|nr:hypothetical protein [Thermoanaerobaculia bacterium]
MRFRVEQLALTDEKGKVQPGQRPRFYVQEAETVDDAVRACVAENDAVLVGEVLRLPGFQAVATVRRDQMVYTLQLGPVSDRLDQIIRSSD